MPSVCVNILRMIFINYYCSLGKMYDCCIQALVKVDYPA